MGKKSKQKVNKPRILVYDIETAPILGDVWSLWQQNVGLNQIHKNGYIMSWCAKWLDEDATYYMDCRENGEADEKHIVQCLVDMLEEADIVVAHNGDNFDWKWVAGRALVYGMPPMAPSRKIDTLKVVKANFRIPSNKLEFIAKFLGCTEKDDHKEFAGHKMWHECLKGNQKAWQEMEDYNRQDVLTLEEVYLKLRPWIRNHPHVGVYNDVELPSCPRCGSTDLNKRGYVYTNASRFTRLRCNGCGSWSRQKGTVLSKGKRTSLVVNAL